MCVCSGEKMIDRPVMAVCWLSLKVSIFLTGNGSHGIRHLNLAR